MIVGFYLDEMNLRGVANSTFSYAYYNEKILMNKSIIFYNSKNYRNKKIVINKFKKAQIGVLKYYDFYNDLKKLYKLDNKIFIS